MIYIYHNCKNSELSIKTNAPDNISENIKVCTYADWKSILSEAKTKNEPVESKSSKQLIYLNYLILLLVLIVGEFTIYCVCQSYRMNSHVDTHGKNGTFVRKRTLLIVDSILPLNPSMKSLNFLLQYFLGAQLSNQNSKKRNLTRGHHFKPTLTPV